MAIIPQNVYYGIKTKYLNKFKIDYQGTVATVSDLPEEDVPKGTVYNVEANGSNYLWNGEEWDELGTSDANVVHKTGDETVGGIKTFSAAKILGSAGIFLGSAVSTQQTGLYGGPFSTDGGSVQAFGNTRQWNPGGVRIDAYFSTSENKTLLMLPNGTFTWDGQAIQTASDERLKTPLASVPDEVLDAWEAVGWGQFQFLEAVSEKGEMARLHLGLVAQRVKAVFEARGLNICDYGILCHEEHEATEDDPAVDLWMIRYTEALAMEAICQRRRADRAEARIKALEDRLSVLEAKLA